MHREMRLTDWLLQGVADNVNRCPGKHEPPGPRARQFYTPEQKAYWDGFFSVANDAFAATARKLRLAGGR
jgi:hypothetical protein